MLEKIKSFAKKAQYAARLLSWFADTLSNGLATFPAMEEEKPVQKAATITEPEEVATK